MHQIVVGSTRLSLAEEMHQPHLCIRKVASRTVQTPNGCTEETATATATLQQQATAKSQATALSNIISPIMLYKTDKDCWSSLEPGLDKLEPNFELK